MSRTWTSIAMSLSLAASSWASGVAGAEEGSAAAPPPDLVEELSVVGTIRGAQAPGFSDTVLLLDVVAGKTYALTIGQCVPRLPHVCVREILDKTILVSARGGEEIEIGRIDGAEPKPTADDGAPPPNGGIEYAAPPPIMSAPMRPGQVLGPEAETGWMEPH